MGYTLQGNYHVDSVFGGKDSVQLKGSEIVAELKYLLNLLTLCWHFSKKPFPLFLEETGYTEENVLFREPKAGVSLTWFVFFGKTVYDSISVSCGDYGIDNYVHVIFLRNGSLKQLRKHVILEKYGINGVIGAMRGLLSLSFFRLL